MRAPCTSISSLILAEHHFCQNLLIQFTRSHDLMSCKEIKFYFLGSGFELTNVNPTTLIAVSPLVITEMTRITLIVT